MSNPEAAKRHSRVRSDVTSEALLQPLNRAFPGDAATANRYATPETFNGLLAWTPGWRGAVIVLMYGLGEVHHACKTSEIAKELGVSLHTIRHVMQLNSPQSFTSALYETHLRLKRARGDSRLYNELESSLGLSPQLWARLSEGGIYTIDQLCTFTAIALKRIPRVGAKGVKEVEAALQGLDRSLKK
jgi:hypothetical protein